MESRENGTDDLICEVEIETHSCREQMYGYQGGKWQGGAIGRLGLTHILY